MMDCTIQKDKDKDEHVIIHYPLEINILYILNVEICKLCTAYITADCKKVGTLKIALNTDGKFG